MIGLAQDQITHQNGARFTIWQQINGSWLIERSFDHAFFRDPAVWEDIRKSQDSSRPYAVFQSNTDPNSQSATG